jgi:hypothetical protein
VSVLQNVLELNIKTKKDLLSGFWWAVQGFGIFVKNFRN